MLNLMKSEKPRILRGLFLRLPEKSQNILQPERLFSLLPKDFYV